MMLISGPGNDENWTKGMLRTGPGHDENWSRGMLRTFEKINSVNSRINYFAFVGVVLKVTV